MNQNNKDADFEREFIDAVNEFIENKYFLKNQYLAVKRVAAKEGALFAFRWANERAKDREKKLLNTIIEINRNRHHYAIVTELCNSAIEEYKELTEGKGE